MQPTCSIEMFGCSVAVAGGSCFVVSFVAQPLLSERVYIRAAAAVRSVPSFYGAGVRTLTLLRGALGAERCIGVHVRYGASAADC